MKIVFGSSVNDKFKTEIAKELKVSDIFKTEIAKELKVSDIFKTEIAKELKVSDILIVDKFSDGEILPRFTESVRDEELFLIQLIKSSDSIIETLLIADAAKRSGCKSFNLVSPYLPYSRQDKTDHLRASIGAKVLADIFEKTGMSRLITIDLHASSIQGFYNTPVIHLNGNKIFTDYIKSLRLDNLCIMAPDQGAVKKANDFAKDFEGASFAMINKKRIKPNEIHSMELVGDVSGKNVIIIDDLADTLGTLKKASELVMENVAISVRAIATHPVLSGNAYTNLIQSKLTELIVADTIDIKANSETLNWVKENGNKLKVISCSPMLARAVYRLEKKMGIHEINQ